LIMIIIIIVHFYPDQSLKLHKSFLQLHRPSICPSIFLLQFLKKRRRKERLIKMLRVRRKTNQTNTTTVSVEFSRSLVLSIQSRFLIIFSLLSQQFFSMRKKKSLFFPLFWSFVFFFFSFF